MGDDTAHKTVHTCVSPLEVRRRNALEPDRRSPICETPQQAQTNAAVRISFEGIVFLYSNRHDNGQDTDPHALDLIICRGTCREHLSMLWREAVFSDMASVGTGSCCHRTNSAQYHGKPSNDAPAYVFSSIAVPVGGASRTKQKCLSPMLTPPAGMSLWASPVSHCWSSTPSMAA